VTAIVIEVDGPDVTMTGTTRGDPVDEASRQGTVWFWSGRRRAYVLPRNLDVLTRDMNISRVVTALRVAGRDVVVENTGAKRQGEVAGADTVPDERIELFRGHVG